jgi:hypothetical protein
MSNPNFTFRLLVTAALLAGCAPSLPPPSPGLADTAAGANEAGAGIDWVTADGGTLELRFSVVSKHMPAGESLHVTAELRNTGPAPTWVLRPFGDWYAAQAVGMKIWDGRQKIRYTGPNAAYVIGSDAFILLKPGEVVHDTMELAVENFAGIERPGTYTLRYDYSYDGQWDTAAAAGNSGVRDPWRGAVASREARISRE